MCISGAVWQPKGTFGKCHVLGTRSGISLWIGLDWAGPGGLWEKRNVLGTEGQWSLEKWREEREDQERWGGAQLGGSSIFSSLIYNWSGPQSLLQTHSSHPLAPCLTVKFPLTLNAAGTYLSVHQAEQWHMIFLKHQHISGFLSVSYLFSFQHLFTYLWFFSVKSVNVKQCYILNYWHYAWRFLKNN